MGVPDELDDAFAGEFGRKVSGQAGLAGEPGAFGVEVDVGAVRVAAVDRLDCAQGTLAHLDQGVGRGDFGASGLEQGVFGFFQGCLYQGAEVGGGAEPQCEPPPLVVGDGELGRCAGAVWLQGEAVPG